MQHYMKKYFFSVMAAALLLTLTACSDRQTPAEEIKSSSKPISSSVAEPPAEEQPPAAETPSGSKGAAEASFIIPPMTDEQAKYNTDYVEPLRFCSMLLKSWSPEDTSGLESTSEYAPGASTSLMFAFEDIIGSDAIQAIYKDYPDGNIPEGIVDEVLLAHFSFTLEQLHELNTFYRPEQKVYEYTGARGGGEVQSVVTQVTEQGDGTILLEYSYLANFPDPTQALYRVPGTMTLVPDGEGSYRYWSVEARESEQY